MQTLTSASRARAWMSFQEGDADLVPLVVAGVEVDAGPGQHRPRGEAARGGGPDMVTTVLTPSGAPARSRRGCPGRAWGRPRGLGSSGLPLQLSAVRVMPAELNSPRSRRTWSASATGLSCRQAV